MFGQQICYYKDGGDNYPKQMTAELLRNGTGLFYAYPITILNIQSIPGVKFYINGNPIPFIIDDSGNITIELTNGNMINIISFDEKSLNNIQNNGYLIISYK